MPAVQSSKMLEKPIYRQCLHTSSYAKAMLIASTGAGAVVVLLLSAGVKRGQAGGRKRYLNSPIPVSAVNSTVADLVDQSTSIFCFFFSYSNKAFSYFVGSINHENHHKIKGGYSGYDTPCLDRCAFFSHKYWDTCLDRSWCSVLSLCIDQLCIAQWMDSMGKSFSLRQLPHPPMKMR